MIRQIHFSIFGIFLTVVLGLAMSGAHAGDESRWGVFSNLAGTSRQGAANGYRVQWHWEKPGEILVEEWFASNSAEPAYTSVITPGTQPGTLLMKNSFLGGKEWDGALQPDGSVVFIGRGMLKLPFHMVLTADNALELRKAKVRDGVLVSEKPAAEQDRLMPIEAAPEAAVAVETPGSSASAPPAMVSIPAKVEVAPASLPAPPAPADYGAFERMIGRSFVSLQRTLDVYREGDALALHYGSPGSGRWGRYLVRPAAEAGKFVLAETATHSGSRNRLAFFDSDGTLVLEYNINGYHQQERFKVNGEAIENTSYSGQRYAWLVNGALKQEDSNSFYPSTTEAVSQAKAFNEQRAAQRRQEKIEEKRERDEQWTRNMNALNEGLTLANEQASASEAQSRAALDATLQAAAIQARREEAQRQRAAQQANAIAPTPTPAPRPQLITETRPSGSQAVPRPQPAVSTTTVAAQSAPQSKPQGCTMVHPKVRAVFATTRGEAIGLQGARDKAAAFCQERTKESGYSAEEKCEQDGQYVLNCTVSGACSGLAPSVCSNSQ
jgi:hypothetical protein